MELIIGTATTTIEYSDLRIDAAIANHYKRQGISEPSARDPLVSYGIPPGLNPKWKRGLSLFNPPGRVKPEGKLVHIDQLPQPSFGALVRHAERYGPEEVLESAGHLTPREQILLTGKLNAIALSNRKGFQTVKTRRISAAELVAAHKAEGLTVPEIVKATGLKAPTVRKHLKAA